MKRKKKVCLFIVEGYADQTALAVPLVHVFKELFDTKEVQFAITYGDITSRNRMNPSNIRAEIGNIVKNFMNKYKLKKTDFVKIIQIIDTDGAFVHENHIQVNSSQIYPRYPYYEETMIIVKSEKNIIEIAERNQQKSQNLLTLSSLPKIMGIQYQTYYFSCNMDHVLHGNANMPDEEKVNKAEKFAERYEKDTNGFIAFFEQSYPQDVPVNYIDSWKYIGEEQNSLEKCSNFYLFFRYAN